MATGTRDHGSSTLGSQGLREIWSIYCRSSFRAVTNVRKIGDRHHNDGDRKVADHAKPLSMVKSSAPFHMIGMIGVIGGPGELLSSLTAGTMSLLPDCYWTVI